MLNPFKGSSRFYWVDSHRHKIFSMEEESTDPQKRPLLRFVLQNELPLIQAFKSDLAKGPIDKAS